jgi:tripartite ATP-independent transporter DctP family solute receptor
MKKIVLGSLALLLCMGSFAFAADKQVVSIRIAHTASEDSSLGVGSLKLQELLNASGLFKAQVYPSAQLGGDRELLEAMQNNDVQVVMGNTAHSVVFTPEAAIFDMPFVYRTKEDARNALNDEEFFAAIAEGYGKSGYHLLGFTDMGLKVLTSNVKVTKPDDIKGLVMRTMENPIHIALWRAIGANPTPIPFNEVYTALQQGTCDALEQAVELLYSSKFYEQQKFAAETNHMLHIIVWLSSKEFYDSLPPEHQRVFDESVRQMLSTALAYSDDNYPRFVDLLKKAGVQFVPLTEAEWQLFADKAKGTWVMIEEAVGPKVYNAFLASKSR